MLPRRATAGIPVTHTLRDASGYVGRVYRAVSTALITDPLRDFAMAEGGRLYWVMNGTLYAVSDHSLTELDRLERLTGHTPRSGETLDAATRLYSADVGGQAMLVVSYPLGLHDLYLAEAIPLASSNADLFSLLAGPAVASPLIILALGAALALLLHRLVATPILSLRRQIERLGSGDLTPDPGLEWNNELGDIGRGLNDMTRNITALMEKRIEDERQKQDLEYPMLQNQINPHFIYNTLNSIMWMATIQHASGIAEMTTALSRLLKSLSKGNERLVLIGMQSMLDRRSLGYEVVGAARNGADALREIEKIRPDIVVTDVVMPVMDGLTLAETCRRSDAALPVFIMLTGYEELEYVKRSIRFGAVEYLNKMDLTASGLAAALERARQVVEKETALRAPAIPPGGHLEQYRERLFLQLYGGLFTDHAAFDRAISELDLHFDAPLYAVALAELQCGEADPDQLPVLSAGVTSMAAKTLPRYLSCWVTGMDLRHFSVLVPLQTAQELRARLEPVLTKAGSILYNYFSTPLYWAVGPPVADILQASQSQQAAFDLLPLLSDAQPVLFSPDLAAPAERIAHARHLMATSDLKVYEISSRVGFESAFYFSKVFKKLEGISPREYIQRVRN